MEKTPFDQVQQAAMARDFRDRQELVERGRVVDFLSAMDEPAEIFEDQPVPPLFLMTLGRIRRPQPSKGTSVKASESYEFVLPVFIGDVLSISSQVTAVEEKEGKHGLAFLITTKKTYKNQRDELVGLAETKGMRWGI